MTWYELKELIGTYTGLERDALHVHAALFLYFISMAVFRQSRRSRLPWLVVFSVELANEAYDLTHNWEDGPEWALSGAAKDLWNTMLWPTVILLVGRYTTWFQKRHDPVQEPEPGAEEPQTT
jgi:hypothetical protein